MFWIFGSDLKSSTYTNFFEGSSANVASLFLFLAVLSIVLIGVVLATTLLRHAAQAFYKRKTARIQQFQMPQEDE